MRILLVNSHLVPRGGDWTYVRTVQALLETHGHEVLLYGLQIEGSATTLEFGELLTEIDFRKAHERRSWADVVHVLRRTLYSREANASIERVLSRYRPDIVHLNNIHHFLTPSIVWPIVRRDIPIVWTLHDYTIICPNTTMLSHSQICEACALGRYYPCVLKKCKRASVWASMLAAAEAYLHHWIHSYEKVAMYIAPSRFLLDKCVAHGMDPQRLSHFPNPIERPGSGSHRHSDGTGVYVGRLSEEKGVKTLLRALAHVPSARCDIIGDGPLRAELEQMAGNLGLNNVRFLGRLPSEQVAKRMGECGFLVIPSEWYENCPYAGMEAMMNGKPVVASAIGGLAEIIEHEVSGILCPPGDSRAFADAFSRLVGEPQVSAQMGREAETRARLLFDSEEYYKKLAALYDCVSSRGVSRDCRQ